MGLLAPYVAITTSPHLSPLSAELLATALTHAIYFWLPSILLVMVPPFLVQFSNYGIRLQKIQPSTPPPSLPSLFPSANVVIKNQFFGLVIQAFFHLVHVRITGRQPYHLILSDTTSSTSSDIINFAFWTRIARDVALTIPLTETFFYFSHRLLHSHALKIPGVGKFNLYKTFHSIHHSFTSPTGLAAQYSHPLEWVLSIWLPVFVAGWLVGTSLEGVLATLAVVEAGSVKLHGGWDWEVSGVGEVEGEKGELGGRGRSREGMEGKKRLTGARRHDRHHEKGGKAGGFGTFWWGWDWVFRSEA